MIAAACERSVSAQAACVSDVIGREMPISVPNAAFRATIDRAC
jgi:hypothetical protein